jgi:hypothetical protein
MWCIHERRKNVSHRGGKIVNPHLECGLLDCDALYMVTKAVNFNHPEDKEDMFLQNVSNHLQDHRVTTQMIIINN